ncbi:hypothetical protein [Nocardia sp. CC227C]|nr:hypothetical protein [Nocardia sp. CC227C]
MLDTSSFPDKRQVFGAIRTGRLEFTGPTMRTRRMASVLRSTPPPP